MTCGPLSPCSSQGRTGQSLQPTGSGASSALPGGTSSRCPQTGACSPGSHIFLSVPDKGQSLLSSHTMQRCEGQDRRTAHTDGHCHLSQQGRVPSNIPLGWHGHHGDWPLLPSPDPMVTDDGQNRQGHGVKKAVVGEPSQQNSPHCPKDMAGQVMTFL